MASASVNQTPQSSQRPSVDIQTPSSRTSSPARASLPHSTSTNRRHRAALRDYYNLQSRSPSLVSGSTPTLPQLATSSSSRPSTSHTTASHTHDPPSPSDQLAEIDTPDFSVNEYVRTVLATQNLSQLMKTEGGLVNDIRGLDGEKKALVYDNYSKLIGATEVIRGMSGTLEVESTQQIGAGSVTLGFKPEGWGVDGLEQKIVDVMEGARSLSGAATATATGSESDDRSTIKCIETPRMRTRRVATVRWVMGAPDRVEKMVRDGRGLEAAREWSSVKKILDQWGAVQGVEQIKRRGEAAFSGV